MNTELMGSRIKETRLERGLTLEDISSELGLAKSTIQRYEAGSIIRPKLPVVEAIAKCLNVNPVWLMGGNVQKVIAIPTKSYPQLLEIGKKRFPLFSGIACGEPLPMDETIETYVSSTTDLKADFVIRAVGESMQPGIHDGDLVFIRSQPMVENGEIAAVAIGDEATLKRVYWYASESIVVLRPDNPNFKELVYKGPDLEEVHILGKAIAYQRDVK